MSPIPSRTGNVSLFTGLFLINCISCILLLCSLTFFFNVGVSYWQFPLAMIIAALTNYLACKNLPNNTAIFSKSLLLAVIIIVVSVVVAGFFYDTSFDGQAYHQEAIYQLKNGWNPYKVLLPDSVNQVLYINHYSKGVEIPQSALYATFNHIETAKATNIILMAAAFCLCHYLLHQLIKLSAAKYVLISLLITLNPVAVNQLLTFYVDGQLATLLLCFMAAGIMVIINPNRVNLLLLASVIIITVNIKFTAIVYVTMFTLAMLVCTIFLKQKQVAKKIFFTAVLAGITGICIIGYNPYVINTIKYNHPFYPLMGKNKIDIMGHNFPSGFENKNNLEKFFISLFSHSNNSTTNLTTNSTTNNDVKPPSLKIPFTLNKDDIVNAPKVDTRISGFGPLFSGVLVLELILFVCVCVYSTDRKFLTYLLYPIGAILVSVFIIPESWWARYIPQLWFVPIIILLAAELLLATKTIKVLKFLVYATITINIMFCLTGVAWNFLITNRINYQLAELKATNETINIHWYSASSNRVRFQEHGIPYKEVNLANHKNVSNIVHSDAWFITPDKTVNLPKSIIIKWAEKYQ